MRNKILVILMLTWTLSACTFSNPKNPGFVDLGKLEDCGPIDYETINRVLIKPRCLTCHGAGNAFGVMELHTYELLKARIGQVEDAVLNNRMPDGAPLSAPEKKYLFAWIAQGAPQTVEGVPVEMCREEDGNPIDPIDPIEPDILRANYDSIRKHVLEANCLGCHGSKAPLGKAKYDFSTYETTVSYTELFQGEPEKTKFAKALIEGEMPMFADPLSDGEITVIVEWIGLSLPRVAGGPGVDLSPPPPTDPLPPVGACDTLDFKKINAEVFQPKCVGCHGMFDSVSLDGFADVKNRLAGIRTMLMADKMPPKNPLAPELKEKVLKWIDQGAIETAPETCTTN